MAIQKHRIRGTMPERRETVSSKNPFSTLSSRRLSIDYNVKFLSDQNNVVIILLKLSFTNMLYTTVTLIRIENIHIFPNIKTPTFQKLFLCCGCV